MNIYYYLDKSIKPREKEIVMLILMFKKKIKITTR